MEWPFVFDFALLARLMMAAVLGGLVGLEREMSGKPAGLRTNLLICVGAALLMELSIGVATMANIQNVLEGTDFRADPARIAAQIVSGIGFLGAGTILVMRGNVVGLTTAATIWVVAAIGMAVGARAYLVALGATAIVLVALALLSRLESVIVERRAIRNYRLRTEPDSELFERILARLEQEGLRVRILGVEKDPAQYELSVELAGPPQAQDRSLRAFLDWPGVHRVNRVL